MKTFKSLIILGALVLTANSCGDEEAKDGEGSSASAHQEEIGALKDDFCNCLDSGTDTHECESMVNDKLSDLKKEKDLGDDEYRQLVNDASAAMRECL